MGYIMDLRKLVGHRPLIMAGACILISESVASLKFRIDWDLQILKLRLNIMPIPYQTQIMT